MLETGYLPKSNNRSISVLVIFVLVLSSMFLLSACNRTSEQPVATSTPAQEAPTQAQAPVEQLEATATPAPEATAQAPTPSVVVDHIVDIDPEPLTEAGTALSLVGYGAKGALADKDLSIADMLMYAAQDEYLAHGEYLAIIAEFGSQKPYDNIVASEETHLAYLNEVYVAFGLTFPDDSSAEHLVIPKDLLEAAKTGVQAEIDNIAMYELFLTYDLPENVFEVFSALKSGSESHLAAFEKQVDKLS